MYMGSLGSLAVLYLISERMHALSTSVFRLLFLILGGA